MQCPACARPIALARSQCAYCGASLPAETQAQAAAFAQRVRQQKSLAGLEVAARGVRRDQGRRNYVVLDTATASVENIAEACGVAPWQARQWQAASRYRLVKVSSGPDDPGVLELREHGLSPILVPEEEVARARHPMAVDSIDLSSTPSRCAVREDSETEPTWRTLDEKELGLVISAPIRRERIQDQAATRNRAPGRIEDAWLVHLYIKGDARPWEIDPMRTGFEGSGVASAHMSTLDLVRRLSATAPFDDGFKNVVPALSPALDPPENLASPKSSSRRTGPASKVLFMDNVTQFREYSAWRGAVEAAQQDSHRARG